MSEIPEESNEKAKLELVFALEQHQTRFFLIASAYFVAQYIGLMQLVSAIPYLGVVMAEILIAMWIVFPTLLFAGIAYRYSWPLKEISKWLDKYLGEE